MRFPRSFCLAVALLLLLAVHSYAHMVIFKDGFIAYGELKRPGEIVADDSGQGIWMPQSTFYLDSGPRRILFGHRQVQDVTDQNPNQDLESIRLKEGISRQYAKHMYPIIQMKDPEPWDENWKRLFKFMAPHGWIDARQRLSVLTPQYARVDVYNFYWSPYYATKELGLNTVQYLLSTNPELKLHGDSSDAARRFRVYRFLAQAGWYDAAEEELTKVDKDFPGEKSKVESAREDLKKVRALQLYESIQLANQAGRHAWVRQHLDQFPGQGVDEKLLAGIRSLRVGMAAASESVTSARRLLATLPGSTDASHRQTFTDAAAAILTELVPENVGRLEPFVNMGLQAERDQKQGRAAAHDASQLLALAVSGWLLGKDSAEAKIDTAERLWRARQFVAQYERTDDAQEREYLRRAYESRRADALGIDELCQLIAFLPPSSPEAEVRAEPMTIHVARKIPGRKESRLSYVVQLPPEYHVGRAYPVVFALHPHREKPEMTLSRIADIAGEHGYIVVAPEWTRPLEDDYGYTAEEHAAVLDVLRDVRRRFQIDSDRVFLLGLQVGGNMAWDVGLAHPDLFAGVAVMGAQPRYFASRYWANAQNLPFYVIDGQYAAMANERAQNGATNSERVRLILDKWLPRGYPALYVEYRGRGLEWFKYEMPYLFDWMDHKRDQHKRSAAVPSLGKHGNGGPLGEEYRTMRRGDNHFYWLSTSALKDVCLNDASEWKNERVAASFQGHLTEGNQIHVNVRGVKDVTVWLGKDMVDFTKPVTVRINGGVALPNRKVTPSLATLLEDLYERGDHQRLFLAKLPFRGL